MHLTFRFAPEANLEATLKLKVEINTREHNNLPGIRKYPFAVNSRWYQGRADIASYEPEELFGTKLRALLQRRKNRDLFDLNEGLKQLGMETTKVIACFEHYLGLEGQSVSRAVAEQRMLGKLTGSLTEDIAPLLPTGVRFDDEDALQAFERVWTVLISRVEASRNCCRRNTAEEISRASQVNQVLGCKHESESVVTTHFLRRSAEVQKLPCRSRGLFGGLGQRVFVISALNQALSSPITGPP
jgi:hypothetical protein